jgi:predicted lipoprotein with Yx(FWY)xxD motif
MDNVKIVEVKMTNYQTNNINEVYNSKGNIYESLNNYVTYSNYTQNSDKEGYSSCARQCMSCTGCGYNL